MKAILIDPYNRRIETVELAERRDVLQLLGCEDPDRLQIHPVSDADHLLTDAAALDVEQTGFFRILNLSPMTFAGRAVLLGHNPGGTKTTDVSMTAEEMAGEIKWRKVRFTGALPLQQGIVNTPQGPGFAVVFVPQFEELPDEPPEDAPEQGPTQPLHIWNVTRTEGGYRAVLLELAGPNSRRLSVLEHESLEELRSQLPSGMLHVPRTQKDASDIVESYVVRRPH